MNYDITIEDMIRLLLHTADRLESYINNGIAVYDSNLINDGDYRVDSAENRIDDNRRRMDKDKKLIKNIKKFAQRRKELNRSNSRSNSFR